MLRRQARLRREYLYRKATRDKVINLQAKKDSIKKSLEQHTMIHPDLRKTALHLQKRAEFEDAGPELAAVMGNEMGGTTGTNEDDEYRWAGVEDPKIVITTSRDPSAGLKNFVKELRFIFPNSSKINRGNIEIKELVQACRANQVTDLIMVHEVRGIPKTLVICHLPYGPTAHFTIQDVVSRKNIPDLPNMSLQYPHLVFHNFKTKLGLRTMSILKYLFPVPKEDSTRVITFANHDDYISFRHHTYKKVGGKEVELTEHGPRFRLKLYKIELGTLETQAAADTEWVARVNMNTSSKRRFLSDDDGWQQEDYV